MRSFSLILALSLFSLSAYSDNNGNGGSNITASADDSSVISSVSTDTLIKINQLGFLPESSKSAVVTDIGNIEFKIVSMSDNSEVFTGKLTPLSNWGPADDNVSIADFSALQTPGEYRLEVEGAPVSNSFRIADDVYNALHDATIKAYYYNRSSTELLETHAGEFARPEGHPDNSVMIHSSAESDQRPTGTIISSTKGWYDAGDFGKYVVNSGISTYTLLSAYENFPEFYGQNELNIPESGDGIPDLLNEIKWNLDWLVTMQDPGDSGVYHKLSTLRFADAIMPHEGTEQRYVVQKGTAATLNFAAVMAVASRIYKNFDAEFPGLAEQYQQAAVSAWYWAENHPNVIYQQPEDVVTGAYGDSSFNDEFAWAAAELYLLTEDDFYLDRFKEENVGLNIPEWAHTHALGYLSLINNGKDLLAPEEYENLYQQLLTQADDLVQQYQESAYGVAMLDSDFIWGSNAVAMNKAMVLLQAYRLSNEEDYQTAALGLLDYILGKNPTDYSYVTGFGHKPPVDIHHRQSEGDELEAPVPGFMAGGPQNGWQDGCEYPSSMPAKSYIDDRCSYSTNEVTINWNAPLVYVLAAFLNQ